MRYEAAVEHLYSLGHELAPRPGDASGAPPPRRKFDLDHMRILAAALGDPQKSFQSILIAGTNGKGSTAATLASILDASNYRTALYTSPHLMRVNERIQVSLETAPSVEMEKPGNRLRTISDEDFARLYVQVDDTASRLVREAALPHSPSFFEVMTAIAFLYFAEQRVDVAVLEVGLGGRLDATNIVAPLISVITDIALDHTEWLGGTIAAIAREKAGILRQNGVLITLPQHPEANQAIGEIAVSLNVRGVNAAEYMPTRTLRFDAPADRTPGNHYTLTIDGQRLQIDSPLTGEHQRRNLALAMASAEELVLNHEFTKISEASIERGIRETSWPARLEALPGANATTVLLDVAHNPAGAWTLRSYLSARFDGDDAAPPRHLIFGALRDKSIAEMAQILFPLFDPNGNTNPARAQDRIHLVAPVNNPRAATLAELQTVAADIQTVATAHASMADALLEAQRDQGATIVIAGSLYLVAEARAQLLAGSPA